ncbi:cytochrome c-type biogenesis protein [Marinomonas communis]|uniref:Cytochrome c-type biogenesis protein n=1 Tax=Marinomonas communis TaxID=28254 RepID=A0A4V3DG80_9GAMM|nr:cytochrome c-type biogenesis protein [Marinomonas communis]MCC4275939.1 cytochrome c-type biogenesis protein CcmH [Marinomonas communis]TDR13361.1 cytochrome c-type biogenesis protein CcmH [Marinomonas communis]
MTRCFWLGLITLIGLCVSTSYAMEVLEFKSTEDQQRFRLLTEELRCPKCQNQNLEDSNAGIAIDLRNQIYTMINEGQTSEEIVDYMVARYGEFVLYRPVHDQSTAILWYGPFALLLIGAVIFVLVMVKNQRRINKDS